MPTRARQGCMRPDQHVADGSVPVLPRGSGHDTPVTGKSASRLTAAPPRLPCRLHKGHGYATAWPQARKAPFLYGPGRAGRGGWARSRIEADFVSRVRVSYSSTAAGATWRALPSKPPSVTIPQPAPHSGTLEAPQRTARRPPSTAAIPFGHERPSGLGSRRTTGALDT